MNVLMSTKDMPHEEWLNVRKNGIGGSDAAAVCGLSRWKSPVEIWMDKTGQTEPKEAGEAAYWGQVMEPYIRKEFALRTGFRVFQRKVIYQHPKLPFMYANLDGFVIDPERGKGIFEAKTANSFVAKEWENDSIPDEYMLQVQHYLAVTGLSFAYVAVLIGGNTFKHQLIERDEDIIRLLLKLETKFWHLVETNTPPQFDGSKSSTELLNRLYPTGKGQIILPDEALNLIEEFEAAQENEKQAGKEKDEAANKLKDILGENETGIINGRTVLWKNIVSERLNSKKIKSDHPEIYQQCVGQSNYRKFSVK